MLDLVVLLLIFAQLRKLLPYLLDLLCVGLALFLRLHLNLAHLGLKLFNKAVRILFYNGWWVLFHLVESQLDFVVFVAKVIYPHRDLLVCLRNLIQDDSERLNALLVNQGNQITFFKVLETHLEFRDDFIELVAERVELLYLYHIFEILVLPTLLS